MRNIRLLKLTFSALLVALSVILIQFFSFKIAIGGAYSMNIGFGVVPVILGGLLMGPGYGAVIGALADFLKAILFPAGAPFLGFTLSYALIGFTPALVVMLLRRTPLGSSAKVDFTYPALLIGVTISQLLFSVGLNSFWLTVAFGQGFWALLPPRLINQLIMSPIHALIIYVIINRKGVFDRVRQLPAK